LSVNGRAIRRPSFSDGNCIVTLWQVEAPERAVAFDRRANVGLHHLALAVVDPARLDALHARVSKWPGVRSVDLWQGA
jgi:hypothetical protein